MLETSQCEYHKTQVLSQRGETLSVHAKDHRVLPQASWAGTGQRGAESLGEPLYCGETDAVLHSHRVSEQSGVYTCQ